MWLSGCFKKLTFHLTAKTGSWIDVTHPPVDTNDEEEDYDDASFEFAITYTTRPKPHFQIEKEGAFVAAKSSITPLHHEASNNNLPFAHYLEEREGATAIAKAKIPDAVSIECLLVHFKRNYGNAYKCLSCSFMVLFVEFHSYRVFTFYAFYTHCGSRNTLLTSIVLCTGWLYVLRF